MCGRTKLTTPIDELRAVFGLAEVPDLEPHYNIAPTQLVAVVRTPGVMELLRFGLVPPWAKSAGEGSRFINARSETVATLPAYREGFRARRCMVIADGFYEWASEGKKKRPHLIRLKSGAPFAFGAVWGSWTSRDGEVIESVSVITTPAQGAVVPLHDRMPLVLAPEDYATWLEPTLASPERLLSPSRVAELVTEPVSSSVSNTKNDGPECIAPPELSLQPSLFG